MAYVLLIGGMVVVGVGLFALVFAQIQRVWKDNPAVRKAAVAMWLRILMAGWFFFLAIVFAVPGGWDGAWDWVAAQPVAMQAAMWVFLLPWMLALGAWNLIGPVFVRAGLMLGIAALTFYLASLLIEPK